MFSSPRKIRQILVIVFALPVIFTAIGCSSSLSRREATSQIDAMLKPHAVGSKKLISQGGVPGFTLAKDESTESQGIFHLAEHKQYGNLTFEKTPDAPSDEDYLVDALGKMGYVAIQEEGPKTVMVTGTALAYSHSRTVRFTQKVGSVTSTGYSRDFSSGFNCYPEPDFAQCSVPPLLEMDKTYTITGIVQDETHAKVNILIPWKLTKFGLELKPYAATIQASEDKLKDSPYYRYAAAYPWEHFLNSHEASGVSPATILFQKFDDGWRIVNEAGKSEKDFD